MDFEAAGTSEAASTLECLRQRILSTVSDWVSRCRIRLVTSNFGTSTGTICVLFDDSCSYDDGNTLSHLWSIIGSLKLISTLRLSIQTVGQASGFVQPWMGDSATPSPRHGRAHLRHGRGDTDLADSFGFVAHSIDLNRFVCFLLCMIIVQ